MSDRDFLEIERKWVLRGLPARLVAFEDGQPDPAIERVSLRQGYLRPATDVELDDFARDPDGGPIRFGRLRAVESVAGTRYLHTVKRGQGLVRTEVERVIDAKAFDEAWGGTEGRRIEKTRWLVREDGAGEGESGVWEIDRFASIDLILAEIEAPDEASAAMVRVPEWLMPVLDREVTHEPAFTNAEIALRLGLGG